jgi:hypothetical protein
MGSRVDQAETVVRLRSPALLKAKSNEFVHQLCLAQAGIVDIPHTSVISVTYARVRAGISATIQLQQRSWVLNFNSFAAELRW